MPAEPPTMPYMSAEEYLAYDRASEMRHEYINGHLIALTGGTVAHNHLTLNMVMLLIEHLGEDGPCHVYTCNMRTFITKRHYFYPDVVVSCEITDHREDSDILYHPRLIVEVLSPSTEMKDRRMKFTCYQQRPSLQEYVLVNTQVQLVEVYRRQPGGAWEYQRYSAGEQLVLRSLNVQFPVSALYGRLRIPVEEVAEDE